MFIGFPELKPNAIIFIASEPGWQHPSQAATLGMHHETILIILFIIIVHIVML